MLFIKGMGEAGKDELVDRFKTYEVSSSCLNLSTNHVQDYLDSQIGAEDLQYLGEAELARTIVELGYRSTGWDSKGLSVYAQVLWNSQQGQVLPGKGGTGGSQEH